MASGSGWRTHAVQYCLDYDLRAVCELSRGGRGGVPHRKDNPLSWRPARGCPPRPRSSAASRPGAWSPPAR
eukprot:1188616-Prorocentrum_minimum.AAC.1